MPLSLQASAVSLNDGLKVNSFGTMRMNMVIFERTISDPWIMSRMQPTSANFSKIMRTLSIRMLLMWPLEPNEQLTWDQLEIQQAQ